MTGDTGSAGSTSTRVSDAELAGYLGLANARVSVPEELYSEPDETPEQRRAREKENQEIRRQREENLRQARESFRTALEDLANKSWAAGAAAAVDRSERGAWNARSVALYLLVLSVVTMPILAIIVGISPQDFGTYIAPITGIAGTVVGYWFGAGKQPTGTTK